VTSKVYTNNKKDRVAHATLSFFIGEAVGLEPIYMELSGGQFL